MYLVAAIPLTCWLCALVAVPRRPQWGNEVEELVYARLLGRQQRLVLLACALPAPPSSPPSSRSPIVPPITTAVPQSGRCARTDRRTRRPATPGNRAGAGSSCNGTRMDR